MGKPRDLTSLYFRSEDFDGVGGQPDVQLLKTTFQARLQLQEKFAIGRSVGHIDKQPHQIIAENLPLVRPKTVNGLRLAGNRSELQASSSMVSETSSSGTGCPSLNRNGSRIS